MSLILLGLATGAAAHPMGNFSVGQYSALSIEPVGLQVRYVIDLAEIPTTGLLPDLGLTVGQPLPDTVAERYRRAMAFRWVEKLKVSLNGRPLVLTAGVGASHVTSGSGGLPTLRMETEYRAAWPLPVLQSFASTDAVPGGPAIQNLEYGDGNYQDLVGLKEVVATCGPGVECVQTTVPSVDVSAALTRYVTDSSVVPPHVREAKVVFRIVRPPTIPARPSDPRVSSSATPPQGPPGALPDGKRAPAEPPASPEVSRPPGPVDSSEGAGFLGALFLTLAGVGIGTLLMFRVPGKS